MDETERRAREAALERISVALPLRPDLAEATSLAELERMAAAIESERAFYRSLGLVDAQHPDR